MESCQPSTRNTQMLLYLLIISVVCIIFVGLIGFVFNVLNIQSYVSPKSTYPLNPVVASEERILELDHNVRNSADAANELNTKLLSIDAAHYAYTMQFGLSGHTHNKHHTNHMNQSPQLSSHLSKHSSQASPLDDSQYAVLSAE